MSDLLDMALEAHGGMDMWRQLTRITVHKTIGGTLWKLKRQDHNIADNILRVDPRRPHSVYSPTALPNLNLVFDGDRQVSVETYDGQVLEYRPAPRAAVQDMERDHPWDLLHLTYFAGYAGWNYLTTPFIFTYPGFSVGEIEPWDEDGETWRRLRVEFSQDIPTHSPVQTFYFDAAGLLRRLDYTADVVGGFPTAHYLYDHQNFSGLVMPTRRKAFFRQPDGRPRPEPISVELGYSDFKLD